MLMLDTLDTSARASARAALIKSLDMATLWQSCTHLISQNLPLHSCSLMFDIDGLTPNKGWHHQTEARDDKTRLVTSLEVAAPYLDANPRIRWYSFSQIASHDSLATERLKDQNPMPGWRDFIHLAFWNDSRLEVVLSLRLHREHTELTENELTFLADLYPLLDACLQRVQALESDRVRHQAFEALLDHLPIAIVLVDTQLTPHYMSREAQRLCHRWRNDIERSGRLPTAIEMPLRQQMQSQACSSDRLAHDAGDARPSTSLTIAHAQRTNQRLRVDIGSFPRSSGPHALIPLTFTATDEGIDSNHASASRTLSLLKCLSPSERKVAQLVAAGLRNDAIAERLCRSRKTIESQISSIFRKLNVANRTQLARMLS